MDNATRKELLYRARAAGYPGSILDVYANYDQGKDLIAEFQDQQRQQQISQMAAQQSGLQQSAQGGQPQIEMQPQPVAMPAVPSFPTPAPKFTPPQPPQPIGVQSQETPVGIVSGQTGPNQARPIFKTGGFKYEEGGPIKGFDLSKSMAENLELNRRARVAGWDSVEEYEKAGWGYNTVKQKQQELINNPEAQKFARPVENKDQLSANKTSGAQKAINQVYYALSNPVEAAGHAMKYGYAPQGNVGNYGHRDDGDAFATTINDFVNPFAWGNAAYRFSKDVTNKDSYTTGMGALNMGADFAESLPFFGAAAKTMAPAVKSFASHPLVNGLHDVAADSKLYGPVYAEALASKAANSLTSPFGIPLYKLPGINKAYKNAAYAVGRQSGMQSRSIKQVKSAIIGKDPKGAYTGTYTGGDFSPTGQNALRQYIFGDASNFEPSSIPQRGLTKYTKKYGPLDNFKLKMSIPDHATMRFFDIAPNEYSTNKWTHLNPELSHLDEMTTHSPEDLLKVQKALEKVIQKKGTLPISMKAPTGYTDTDIAGHTMFLTHDPATGEISSHIQDIWKFTPEEYAKKWTIVGNPEGKLAKTQDLNQYKIYQQAKLMEKAGKPFVTHDVRPFEIFPQFRGKPSGVPEVFHLADDVDPNDVGFKTVTNSINLKKPITTSKKLGGTKCYTCVGRKRRV